MVRIGSSNLVDSDRFGRAVNVRYEVVVRLGFDLHSSIRYMGLTLKSAALRLVRSAILAIGFISKFCA